MSENKKLNSVHFLRFFAAIAVVCHHSSTVFSSSVAIGAAGVDIFFIISGLVIGLSLLSKDSPREFALKRSIRVLPIYWVATMVFIGVTDFDVNATYSFGSIARSLALWPVFGTGWHPIYFAGWSLCYEMLFYVIATVALLCVRKHAWFACILVMAVLSTARIPVPFSEHGLYFGTQICLEFCFGLLIAEAIRRQMLPAKKHALWLVGAAIIIFVANYTDGGARQIVWGVPSAMLVVGLLAFDDAPFFKNRLVTLGGDASYSIYLTHITTLSLIYYFAFDLRVTPSDYPWTVFFIEIMASVLVGFPFHIYIEKPVLRILRRFLLAKANSKIAAETNVVDQVPAG